MRRVSGGAAMTNTAGVDGMASDIPKEPRPALSPPASERLLWTGAALLFSVSAGWTIIGCVRMWHMEEMPMDGGWTMSMTWMRMPGQSWLDAGGSFLGMWIPMMVAMMLPVLLPVLRRYRRNVDHISGRAPEKLTLAVAMGYFFVWGLLGLALYPLGMGLAALAMRHAALASHVPTVTGLMVVIAGALQFTRWKIRHLNACRKPPSGHGHDDCTLGSAWRQGIGIGLHCCYCSAGLTAVLMVAGVMNPVAMALVTIAVAVERLTPAAEPAARAIGMVTLAVGLVVLGRAMGEF